MSQSHEPTPNESIPQVFERIAETARGIDQESQQTDPQTFSKAEPVRVEKYSACGRVGATVTANSVERLYVSPMALEELEWHEVERLLVGTINEAMKECMEADLEQLTKINASFGALVNNLGGLQADLEAAFRRDMGRLD